MEAEQAPPPIPPPYELRDDGLYLGGKRISEQLYYEAKLVGWVFTWYGAGWKVTPGFLYWRLWDADEIRLNAPRCYSATVEECIVDYGDLRGL